jgi:hypothetical protein
MSSIAYIEENLKMRRQQQDTSESKPQDPDEFELRAPHFVYASKILLDVRIL